MKNQIVNLKKYCHDKKIKIPVILIMLYFTLTLQVMGQSNQTLNGKVIGAGEEPIIGATIRETGTDRGTVTDIDGHFSLTVAIGSQIQISYIGYQTQTITITNYE